MSFHSRPDSERNEESADPFAGSAERSRDRRVELRARGHRRAVRRRWGLALVLVVAVALIIELGRSATTRHLGVHPARVEADAGPRPRSSSAPVGYRSSRERASAAIERVLTYTPYISVGSGRRREVALSFDDGPSVYTRQLIAVLRHEHAAATFFEIGIHVREFPQITRLQARDGFAIGDHTEDHPPMGLLSSARQRAELLGGAEAIQAAGAPYPRLFRPPYGSFDERTLELLAQLHMLMVLWTVDTSDYQRPGVARIVYTALSGSRPGAIILMHDGGGDRTQTIAALPRIIRGLRRRSYRLVTVPQLLADDPPPRNQPPPTPLMGNTSAASLP
jgi:peptidoglycan/xylan/chitin deacetylase (PgdA/CDA1 family)